MEVKDVIIKNELKLDEHKTYKIGLFSDIHGNDAALKVVLNDLSDCDYIISLGDLSGIGPNSNEVFDIVTKLNNFYAVMGNHERYLLFGFSNPLSCLTFDQQHFTESSISEENLAYIKTLPLEIEINWKGEKITLIHYARKYYDNIRFKLIDHHPSYHKLCDLFTFHDAEYIFYGHEHVGSIYEHQRTYLGKKPRHFVNFGSCGCPCPTKNTLRYGILTLGETIKYEVITKEYDASSMVKSMIDKEMPNKEKIIKDFYKEDISLYQ